MRFASELGRAGIPRKLVCGKGLKRALCRPCGKFARLAVRPEGLTYGTMTTFGPRQAQLVWGTPCRAGRKATALPLRCAWACAARASAAPVGVTGLGNRNVMVHHDHLQTHTSQRRACVGHPL